MIPPHLWFTPVPKLFWSEYSEGPFANCVDCERPLEESDFYLIQKCYVGGEPVFEFAICGGCRSSVSAQCSEETNRAVHQFLMEHLLKRERDFEYLTEVDDALKRCLDECIVCCKARSECYRYNVGGLFRSADLVVQLSPQAQSPLMICENCEASMSRLVSQQTRDTWDRFVQEKFDGPPGINIDTPSGTPVLI